MSHESVVKSLTADVIRDCAPDESLLVASYSPTANTNGSTSRGPQGAGIEAAIVLLLPVVYKFFDKYVEGLAKNAADGTTTILKRFLADSSDSNEESLSEAIAHELASSGIDPARTVEVAASVMKAIEKHKASLAGM